MQWMENVQNGGDDEIIENNNDNIHNNKYNNTSMFDEDFLYPFEKYTKEANWKNQNNNTNKWHKESHDRVKRANNLKSKEEHNKNTCSLYIQTDPLIWRHIREGIADVSLLYY